MSILVCDDSSVILDIFDQILERRNYEIVKAFDGEMAIELAQSLEDIKLIFMDLNMPRISGWEATKKIRKFHPHVPIIAMSATISDEEQKKAKKQGFRAAYRKPLKIQDIRSILDTYITQDAG